MGDVILEQLAPDDREQFILDCACLFSKRNTASMSRYAKTRVQVLHIAKMKTPTKYCK